MKTNLVLFLFFIIKKSVTKSLETTNIEIILVNFDPTLECLLREIRYVTSEPLNLKIPPKFRELIPILENDRNIR